MFRAAIHFEFDVIESWLSSVRRVLCLSQMDIKCEEVVSQRSSFAFVQTDEYKLLFISFFRPCSKGV